MSFGGGAPAAQSGDSNNNGILDDLELAQFEAEQQRLAKEAEQQQKDAELARLAELGGQAYNGARSSAESLLSSYGVDPAQYGTVIDRVLNSIRSSIGQSDPNPGAYYSSAPQRVVDEATDAERRNLNRTIDTFAPYNFEATRVPYSIDDAVSGAILAENRSTADQYLQNLLSRGVITSAGYAGGQSELDRQSHGVQAMLDEIGQGLIEGQRGSLRDIAGTARVGASTYDLGQIFNPDQYRTQLDQTFNDFINNLGSRFRSRVSGPLFNTKGLAAIAGSAQHAQNTPFDPNALAGIFDDNENDPNAPAGSSVFL